MCYMVTWREVARVRNAECGARSELRASFPRLLLFYGMLECKFQIRLGSGVRKFAPHDSSGGGEGVLVRLFSIQDMHDLMAFGFQVIGDKRPMAAPPEQLRAHDRSRLVAREVCARRAAQ